MPDLRDIVFERIGELSMCWSETPKGVFDSERATRIGAELVQDIKAHEQEEHEHDYDIRIGEHDLIRWCRRCGVTFQARRSSSWSDFSDWQEVKDGETAAYLVNQS